MDKVKRRPGRPKGSETDDSAPLMAMARRIADNPGLPPKTAARRVFKDSGRAAHLEDASIHRWQGKWKTAGASYLQRVQDERAAAEAEQRRRERVAAEARERGRKSWPEIMAELQAAGRMPGLTVNKEFREMLERHDRMMGSLSGLRALAAGHALPKVGLTAFEAFADARRHGIAGREVPKSAIDALYGHELREVMRAADPMGIAGGRFGGLDNPALTDTMRKYGDIGRALEDAGAFGQGFKLPKGI